MSGDMSGDISIDISSRLSRPLLGLKLYESVVFLLGKRINISVSFIPSIRCKYALASKPILPLPIGN